MLRALFGRMWRTWLRTILVAWRSHCDKARMLKNMRGDRFTLLAIPEETL